ncbi:MAG: cytochrome P450 [Pseudomonadota bacterium]
MPAVSTVNRLAAVDIMTRMAADPLSAGPIMVRRYGHAIKLPSTPGRKRSSATYVFSTSAWAEQVLKNDRVFATRSVVLRANGRSLHDQIRLGYFSLYGDRHLHYLNLIGKFFSRRRVEQTGERMCEIVAQELDRWPDDGTDFDVTEEIAIVMRKLAVGCIFDHPDDQLGLEAAEQSEKHGRLAGFTLPNYMAARFGARFGAGVHGQANKTAALLNAWARSTLDQPADANLLAALAKSPPPPGEPSSDLRLSAMLWTLLGAAFDTSVSITSTLLVLLARHPDVARKLDDELQAAGDGIERDLTRLMKLPYLDAVVKEALRLVPPAPYQHRRVEFAAQVGSVQFNRADRVYLNAWAINRDPSIYKNPEHFDPDRWFAISPSPYQFLSFSGGPRRCIGLWFGYAFVKSVIAAMLCRWKVTFSPDARVNLKTVLTVRAADGLLIGLSSRDGAFTRSDLKGNFKRYLPAC